MSRRLTDNNRTDNNYKKPYTNREKSSIFQNEVVFVREKAFYLNFGGAYCKVLFLDHILELKK